MKKGVNTNKEEIQKIFSRGISKFYPSREDVEERLLSGKRLKIYGGMDATGVDLHIGHSKQLILLERLRRLGHEIIILFGDFTAMIGDPSDKSATRVLLTKEQVASNISTWKKQVSHILSFDEKENPAKVVQNSQWLSRLSFSDVVDLASNFTVGQMIERDMFENRIKDGKPVYLHEFLYPLMQGYDSVSLDVDGEIGGTDQTFNMLAGRTLQKTLNNKDKFVITTTLLADPKTGKKIMSKSEGDYIGLNDEPNDMFGKTMALPDDIVVQLFKECTFLELEEVSQKEDRFKDPKNKMEVKKELAWEFVKMYHSEDEAIKARKSFEETFGDNKFPADSPTVFVSKNDDFMSALIKSGLVESKSELKRLAESGAITDVDTEEKITDLDTSIENNKKIKIGKKRFLQILLDT